MKVDCAIDIDRSPQVVFPWLGTPEKAMEWQRNVTGTEIVHRTPDMTGTTFKETLEENGRSLEMRGIVTEYRENKRLAMHLESRYNRVDIEYVLVAIAEKTRVVVHADVSLRSFPRIITTVFPSSFRRKLVSQLEEELGLLKDLCESSQAYE